MSFVEGKVALVTGGASGIGLSIVQKLLENGIKGVGLVDISENGFKIVEDFQKLFMNKVIFIKADVTAHEQLEGAFEKTIHQFKNLDIVINNAGIVNELQWEKCLTLDLVSVIRGTFLSVNKYLPIFKTGEECVIINIAAVCGINAIEDLPIYTAVKQGVVGFGKALGSDKIWRKHKIRIITICPGMTATPLLSGFFALNDLEISKEELLKVSKMASSPEYVGTSVVKIINEGTNGSVWVVENEEMPYEIIFPYRTELRK